MGSGGSTPATRDQQFTHPGGTSQHASMKELLDQNLFTDLKLVVEGEVFDVHKSVLYTSSVMLKNMLTAETSDKYKDQIELKGVDLGSFKLILAYMYTGKITVTIKNVTGILQGAEYFLMTELKDFCLAYVDENLSVDTAFDALRVADMFNQKELKTKVIKFIFEKHQELAEQIKQCTFEELRAILQENKDNTADCEAERAPEENVFTAVLQWLGHDSEARHQHTVDLIPLLRFDEMSSKFLKNSLADEVIKSSLDLREQVVSTLVDRFDDEASTKGEVRSSPSNIIMHTFSNVSEMALNDVKRSAVQLVDGVPWQIEIVRSRGDNKDPDRCDIDAYIPAQIKSKDHLGVFLSAVEPRSVPGSRLGVTIRLLPWRYDCNAIEKKILIPDEKSLSAFGYRWFEEWSSITKTDLGFMSQDGRVTIQISLFDIE